MVVIFTKRWLTDTRCGVFGGWKSAILMITCGYLVFERKKISEDGDVASILMRDPDNVDVDVDVLVVRTPLDQVEPSTPVLKRLAPHTFEIVSR
jgi:hypothetical protein